jgi:NitT/TauT family transport system substrate-binding protein
MKRVARAAAGLLLAVTLLPGCGTSESDEATASGTPSATAEPTTEPTTIRIASLKGPTTMGLVELMDQVATGEARHDYQVTMYGTPDEIVPLVAQGEVDVALVPANLAAVLYNRTEGAIKVAAINTLGVIELLEDGDTIHSIADLAGRTIYSTGKGASPEYVLNYLLTSNGLDPATDVTVDYRSEATEVAALLAAEPGAVGVLPQPYATVLQAQNPAIRTALSFTDEWADVSTDSQLVTGVAVVSTKFAEENPEALAEFLADYRASTEFTNDNPADAAQLIADAGIVPSAEIAEAAIPACNITFIDGAELKTVLSGYLQVLFDADPAAVGGTMPGDDFYYATS